MTESESVRLARFEEKLDAMASTMQRMDASITRMATDCPEHRADISSLKTSVKNIEEHTIPGIQANVRELFNRNWAALITALAAIGGAVLAFLFRGHQ